MNLKNIISDISNWASNFIGKILPSSRDFLNLASTIVNFVKNFDGEHPKILDTLVSIIPGKLDDHLLEKLRNALPNIVVKMKLAQDEANKTPDEIFTDAVKLIQSMEPEYRAVALGGLWVHISNVLTDNGVSLKDLQKLQQVWYDQVGKVSAALTPKQKCEIAHSGECGVCDTAGGFTPCA